MTVYRCRAASSPLALRRGLKRRKHGLEAVARGAAPDLLDDLEATDQQDLDELVGDARIGRFSSSLPEDPRTARQELVDVTALIRRLDELGGVDSKRDEFLTALDVATNDGRACLVFSEFTDTVEYRRDLLFPRYSATVACYAGECGSVWRDGAC